MNLTRRTTAAVALAAAVTAGALGVAPAAAGTGSTDPGSLDPSIQPDPHLAPGWLTTPLTYSIHDTQVLEGAPGDGVVLAFEVVSSKPWPEPITFHAYTQSYPGVTPYEDYVPVDKWVGMPAGATSTIVEVPVVGDMVAEDGDEHVALWVNLFSAGKSTAIYATGTIVDDDILPPPLDPPFLRLR